MLFRLAEHAAVAAVATCVTLLLTCRRRKEGGGAGGSNPEGSSYLVDSCLPISSIPAYLSLASTYLSAVEEIKIVGSGPEGLLHGDWGGLVQPAPPPSMDVTQLKDGGSTSYSDGRGAIYRFKIGGDVIVNMYFTKAGYRRSGDVHDCVQYDVVLRGRTRLRMLDPHTGKEIVREYGAHDFIVIPARTPHMFEFLEDNYLLEWWGGDFAAWYYTPYRSIIERNLPLADTTGLDLSIDLSLLCAEAPHVMLPGKLHHMFGALWTARMLERISFRM